MPACPSCGATVSASADFCGECGGDLSSGGGGEDAGVDLSETGQQITQQVKQTREAEADGGLGPRAKGALYTVGGVVALGVGYWLTFVGYTEVGMGPQGFGVYEVTYPIPGGILLIIGLLVLIGGLAGLAGEDVYD